MRSHGVTPVADPGTGIAVVTRGGRRVFTGRAEGPIGHYVARVELPGAGAWRWEVVQGGDPVQDLGTLTVLPADPGAAP
ncbi:MAG: hypothetical protein QOD86_2514, partial [Miltoncostaeaceae bacterium]|nr:hypothetical protein [Miltoncostaeaceae bacterium]